MAHFEYSSVINTSPDKVFGFLTQPENLPQLLPSDYKLVFTASPPHFKKGVEYHFRLSRFGISALWGVYIEEVEDGVLIRERQTHGPFSLWVHTQKIEEHSQGTLLTDLVEYDLAFGLFGKLAQDLYLRNELRRFFEARHKKLQGLLSRPDASAGGVA